MAVSTVPLAVTCSPPSAVAPGSVKASPWVIVMGLLPLRVMMGEIVSIVNSGRVRVPSFPDVSVMETVQAWTPSPSESKLR